MPNTSSVPIVFATISTNVSFATKYSTTAATAPAPMMYGFHSSGIAFHIASPFTYIAPHLPLKPACATSNKLLTTACSPISTSTMPCATLNVSFTSKSNTSFTMSNTCTPLVNAITSSNTSATSALSST